MIGPSHAQLRGFILRETRLREVPGIPGIRLYQTEDVTALWHRTASVLRLDDPPLPYWAFAWSGGLGVVRFLLEQPLTVRGQTVLDLGSGSGLCGIVAATLGAASVVAVDVDPLAAVAAELNAHSNGVELDVKVRDLLDDSPPTVDVILAGDVSYEEQMAARMLRWLQEAAAGGSHVLLGDPGRRWFQDGAATRLAPVGDYTVQVDREIEEGGLKRSTVYTLSR